LLAFLPTPAKTVGYIAFLKVACVKKKSCALLWCKKKKKSLKIDFEQLSPFPPSFPPLLQRKKTTFFFFQGTFCRNFIYILPYFAMPSTFSSHPLYYFVTSSLCVSKPCESDLSNILVISLGYFGNS